MVTIQSLHVEGLNGRLNYDLQFNERLNILTGRNGSGKTSILKLLWYAVSNLYYLNDRDIKFEKIKLSYNDGSGIEIGENGRRNFPDDKQSDKSSLVSTYFFPTFRLIEKGFGMDKNGKAESLFDDPFEDGKDILFRLGIWIPGNYDGNKFHHLVFQVSHYLVRNFLLKKYAEIKSLLDDQFKKWDDELDVQLRIVEGEGEKEAKLFRENRDKKKNYEAQMMQPFTTLNNLIAKFYQDKGIQITQGIVLGSKDYIELAENLSSGEKQMLTFLAYSLFTKDSIIFIDEPEISLHPDWQTDLIPTLMSQNNGNQYFIATHSPFIYADYLDYDINLDELRSENSVNQAVHE